MKKCVIGIDGGGTKTHLKCVSEDNVLLYEGFGGSSNICSNSIHAVKAHLTDLFAPCLCKIESTYKLTTICLGTAGVSKQNAVTQLTEIIHELTQCQNIIIKNDVQTALVANLSEQQGVLVIAGTGAIALGKRHNQEYRCGGWGHLVSDEGSAYWIAKEGVQAALKSYDGRSETSKLYQAILEALQINTHEALIQTLYDQTFTKDKMASLAQVVATVSEQDVVAREILLRAGTELFDLTKATITKLQLDAQPTFEIIVAGSVLLNNETVRNQLIKLVAQTYENAIVKRAHHEAVNGAVAIAIGG